MIVPLSHLLIFAAVLFCLGLICVLIWRTNVIMLLIGIEIMLNSAMLVFVAGSSYWGKVDGQIFALMIMAMMVKAVIGSSPADGSSKNTSSGSLTSRL